MNSMEAWPVSDEAITSLSAPFFVESVPAEVKTPLAEKGPVRSTRDMEYRRSGGRQDHGTGAGVTHKWKDFGKWEMQPGTVSIEEDRTRKQRRRTDKKEAEEGYRAYLEEQTLDSVDSNVKELAEKESAVALPEDKEEITSLFSQEAETTQLEPNTATEQKEEIVSEANPYNINPDELELAEMPAEELTSLAKEHLSAKSKRAQQIEPYLRGGKADHGTEGRVSKKGVQKYSDSETMKRNMYQRREGKKLAEEGLQDYTVDPSIWSQPVIFEKPLSKGSSNGRVKAKTDSDGKEEVASISQDPEVTDEERASWDRAVEQIHKRVNRKGEKAQADKEKHFGNRR